MNNIKVIDYSYISIRHAIKNLFPIIIKDIENDKYTHEMVKKD